MLKITSDGRKLGLDQRIINPMLPDEPQSKVNLCVDNIYRIWDEGQSEKLTQLVFCDISTPKAGAANAQAQAAKAGDKTINGLELRALENMTEAPDTPDEPAFTVYEDIRRSSFPAAFHRTGYVHPNANTDVRKKELFAKVRSGQVRVLQRTFKMGATKPGSACGAPDLDCPWARDLSSARRIVRKATKRESPYFPLCDGRNLTAICTDRRDETKFISDHVQQKSCAFLKDIDGRRFPRRSRPCAPGIRLSRNGWTWTLTYPGSG